MYRNLFVVSKGESAATIAEMTATPSTPDWITSGRFSKVIPPIAMTGIETAVLISLNRWYQ